jgi:hypothetical protein
LGRNCIRIVFSGRQCPQDIRGRTLVPRIVIFGPAAPSRHSRRDFGPSNCSFRAGSAFETFEAGLRSLESSSRANIAFKIFEEGLRSLELLLSGQQRLQDIRGRASAPRITSFGPAAPSRYSKPGFGPSNRLFGLVVTSKNSSSSYRPSNHPLLNLSFELSMLLNQHARILVAIYQFGCRMSNTKVSPRFATPDGPVFVSNALYRKFSIPTV